MPIKSRIRKVTCPPVMCRYSLTVSLVGTVEQLLTIELTKPRENTQQTRSSILLCTIKIYM